MSKCGFFRLKAYIQKEFKEHLDANLELYIENKLSSSQRRVLTTKLVGNTWKKIKENKDLIKYVPS